MNARIIRKGNEIQIQVSIRLLRFTQQLTQGVLERLIKTLADAGALWSIPGGEIFMNTKYIKE